MRDPAPQTTIAEYLELDAEADGKLELLNGVVVAMAGASPRHNQIVSNVAFALNAVLRKGPCRVFSQDQRVQVEATESYLYPDIVVVCEEPSFDTSARPASLRNPSAIVEVLSRSTLDLDLGAKLGHYRRIPSVREVLLIHAEERRVTTVTRQDDGSWKLVDTGPEGEVELSGVCLSLDTIYERSESLPGS
ncbi:hypothetical protein ENSA5_02430 [Enhygromyxa salina]|uniref:Putative restriction endonuclease domain-containing protein n=1 Tax=Enhygromyxa salina TaxID=215803 RepID=A0A2S9YJY9_9BACT|nr:Uma2 family endonuclease [Enhygromyxa salina]PRQ05423.1 hypothetical protein ENSA5_02430 [Enhygromyxa salina]